ncbi:MAG TPA: hydrolase [Longimicrobiales bacterium]|nr:hydrolase [Longimicrobiales bacterium]
MKLAETKYDNRTTGCCADVDPAAWDGRTLVWTDQRCVKEHIRALLHVPLNFGAVMSRAHAAIEKAEAYPEQPLWLCDETSPWGSDLYVPVDRAVPGARTEMLSGTFVTKVFEGPYRDAGNWVRAMREHVSARGLELVKLYVFYATCPKCAKRLGHNRAVLFAQVR